jgi:hypothetical protein
MHTLDSDTASMLQTVGEPPCLSLYQTTHRHHPENQQDPIRFRNLVKSMEASLGSTKSTDDIAALLAPFHALADDHEFWSSTRDGLAVFGAKDVFRVYRLQRAVADLAIVADSFHLKPLMRLQQATDRYQVLGISRNAFRLFEGNHEALDELAPDSRIPTTMSAALGDELTEKHQTIGLAGGVGGGHHALHFGIGSKQTEVDHDDDRFFRMIDKAILEYHSRPSGLPLILATLPEHRQRFRRLSHNPFLLATGIDHNPDTMSLDALREAAWQVVAPQFDARLAALSEEFGTARANSLGDDDLPHVAKAIANGQVATLLIEADREILGRFDVSTGLVQFADMALPSSEQENVDDLLDDLAESTMKFGGRVVVVPGSQMPTTTGLAAIYRFSDPLADAPLADAP